MNECPKLSIIIPIYNKENFLRRCLDSIKNQTFEDFECLMIDDGSTDGSGSICKEYENTDTRFHYIHKENSGWASEPKNVGLDLAKGEWVGFPDPDDYCELNMYEVLLSNSSRSDIVMCKLNAYDVAGNKYVNYNHEPGHYTRFDDKILSDNKYDIGFCNRGIFRRSVIGSLRYIHSFCEDCIWNAAVLNKSQKGLTIINDKLYNYFLYPDSLVRTSMSNEFLLRSYKEIYEFVFRNDVFADNDSLKQRLINHLHKYLSRRCKSIDFVVPIVDSTKESFKSDFKKYSILENHYAPDRDEERYSYNDEMLKFMFRSIDKYMNWIGVLHVIVRSDEDIPEWLDRSKVNIIYHSDYIPKQFLPTFNSGTIESFMSNLLLSENYIYSNDDMIVLNDLKSTDFFKEANLLIGRKNRLIPVNKLERTTLQFFERDETCQSFLKMMLMALDEKIPFHPFIKLNIIREKNLYFKCRHIMSPLKLSRIKYLTAKNIKEINNSCTRFRSNKNIAYWYFTYDQVFNTQHIDGGFPYSYIGRNTKKENIKRLLDRNLYKATCINNMSDFEEMVMGMLRQYFPNKCSYEL